MKRLPVIIAAMFFPASLGMGFYAVRELLAALVLFSVGFVALLLITLIGMLGHWLAHRGDAWFQARARHWDRAWRDWIREFIRSLRWPQLWPRWNHKSPARAAHLAVIAIEAPPAVPGLLLKDM